jgi:3'-phosphoadenosine 5'-phosphosulfate sulfotransferase (PAPS reductase)/FAD synthetase
MSDIITDVEEIPTDAQHFALFSGGNDSIASTHYIHEQREIDFTVYLDTNSGIPENKEYVIDVCDEYGWDLAVLSSPVTLKEFAVGTDTRQALGFPGPGAHSWAFQYFKERQLSAIATQTDPEPRFYTGVRSAESDRRMQNIDENREQADRWVWVNPICEWSDSDVGDYRNKHDLPKNPVNREIGRSGDCLCGAFANRTTELVELETHYPEHYEWLMGVEEEVQQELGKNKASSYWGFGDMDEKELRAEIAKNDDKQMMLCSNCDVPDYPTEDNND